jgi:hypothetical protein
VGFSGRSKGGARRDLPAGRYALTSARENLSRERWGEPFLRAPRITLGISFARDDGKLCPVARQVTRDGKGKCPYQQPSKAEASR